MSQDDRNRGENPGTLEQLNLPKSKERINLRPVKIVEISPMEGTTYTLVAGQNFYDFGEVVSGFEVYNSGSADIYRKCGIDTPARCSQGNGMPIFATTSRPEDVQCRYLTLFVPAGSAAIGLVVNGESLGVSIEGWT